MIYAFGDYIIYAFGDLIRDEQKDELQQDSTRTKNQNPAI